MQVWFWIWLAVIVLSIVIEAITFEMISVWFAGGAIIPLILSACNVSWEIQMILFVIITALLIIFFRKMTLKYLLKNSGLKTNVDSLVGKTARMLEETDFDTNGKLKIGDVIWTAVGDERQTINKGAIVEIVAISGNKLKVREKPEDKKDIEKEANKETKQENKKEKKEDK